MVILPYFIDSVWIFKDNAGNILFKSKEKFSYVSAFVNNVARFNINGKCNIMDECEGGKWGIIDHKGRILINNLDWIGDFVGDYAIFQKDYKFGLIRKDGRIIIPAKLEEIIIIDENFIFYRVGDKWGIANGKGEILFPSEFNGFIKINDSLFLLTKGGECDIFNRCEGSKYGIISKSGKFLIPLRFDGIGEIKDSFVEVSYDGLWGLMKLNGRLIIDTKFEDILYFKGFVWFKENNKWGLMDLNKKTILKPSFFDVLPLGNIEFLKFKLDDKWGIIRKDGKIISDAKFDNIIYLGDEYFLVERNNLKGVMDTGGSFVIPINFKDISYNSGRFAFFDGRFWMYKNMKFEYVEILGNILLAQNGSLFGIVDSFGNVILDFHYDSIKIVKNFILAKKNDRWIIFDKKFNKIVENVDSFEINDKFLKFRKLNKWGIIYDENNIWEAVFDYIDNEDENGIIRVVKDGKFGLLKDGKMIIEPKYKFIYRFYKDIYKLILENSFEYYKL
ncbi:MAG: WG repeat-containing protein [candidate division WOR-3 bacterium]